MTLPAVRGFDPHNLEHVLNLVTSRPRTKDELWNWVRVVLNVTIPRTKVCPGCCAPFDAFAEAYFAEEDTSVWWASRGSGKTFLLATLCMAELLTLHATINLMGGSGEQAKRVLAYLQGEDISAQSRFWDAHMPRMVRPVYTRSENLSEVKTVLGSIMKALLASGRAVRGPHPARLRMDEVDEIKLKLFDAAMGQTLSQGAGWRIVPQQMVLSSTYQHPDGTMTEVLDRAKKQGWAVRKWCVSPCSQILTKRGWVSARSVQLTDQVLTREGWRPLQHVTCTGWKPTLEVELENGRTLVLTADHHVAVPGGWQEAGELRPGSLLVTPPFGGSPQASAAVASSVRSFVGVFSAVGVTLGALGPLHLGYDAGCAAHILAVGDRSQVVGVDASRIPAGVIQLQTPRNFAPHHSVNESVCHPLVHPPQGACRPPVALLRLAPKPVPASVLGHENFGEKPRCAEFDFSGHVRVIRVSPGAILPVWDLGVEATHEFTAEGVIVHNCYREVLQSNGGWLSDRDIEIKRKQTPAYMWDAEYENNEPSAEGRIWTTHEMDNVFLERLGEFRGDPMEQVVLHPPDPRFTFYHGGDWARDVNWSVFHTMLEKRSGPDELAAWRRMGRMSYKLMADAYSDQVNAYKGRSAYDGTGVGKVIGDLLNCSSEPIDFGKTAMVNDIFNKYVVAIQNQEVIFPRIAWMETEHRRFTLEQLRNYEHRPDSVVAGALAWYAKSKAPRLLIGRPTPGGLRR